MIKYNHTTQVQLLSSIKEALGDLDAIHFIEDDIRLCIKEALLTFGAISGFWKDEIGLITEENKRIYNIFVDLNVGTTAPTLKYRDLLDWINHDLIESLSEDVPVSDYYSLSDILELIKIKYNAFQLATNLIISNAELDVEAGTNIVELSNDTLDIIRLVFTYENDGNNYEIILNRVDEQELSYFDSPSLIEERIPEFFSTIYGSPNEIKLYPIPNISGKLKALLINGQDTTDPITIDTNINLPNNLVPYLKYGVEYDLFNKDGLLNDINRAAYCNNRWQEGLVVGKNYSSILIAKANGLVINTDSLNKLDDWISPRITSDPPTILGLAGFNIFEIDTIPNTDVNAINLLITQNASLPATDADFIDIEIGYIKSLINYCVHITQLKDGASELQLTDSYKNDFLKIALGHNSRLSNRGVTFENLIGRTKKEEKEKPKLATIEA